MGRLSTVGSNHNRLIVERKTASGQSTTNGLISSADVSAQARHSPAGSIWSTDLSAQARHSPAGMILQVRGVEPYAFSLAIVHWGVSPLGLGLQLRPPDFWGTG